VATVGLSGQKDRLESLRGFHFTLHVLDLVVRNALTGQYVLSY